MDLLSNPGTSLLAWPLMFVDPMSLLILPDRLLLECLSRGSLVEVEPVALSKLLVDGSTSGMLVKLIPK